MEGISEVAVFGAGLHITLAHPGAHPLAHPGPDPGAATPRIRSLLEQQGIRVQRLEPIQPSIEDVFVGMITEEERKSA